MRQLTQDIDCPYIHGLEKFEQIHGEQSKRCESDFIVRVVVPKDLARSATFSESPHGSAHITS